MSHAVRPRRCPERFKYTPTQLGLTGSLLSRTKRDAPQETPKELVWKVSERFFSPPLLSCTPSGLLSTLSRGTDNGCSVAPSVTNGSSNETPPACSSSKPASLANVLAVTGVGFHWNAFSPPHTTGVEFSKSLTNRKMYFSIGIYSFPMDPMDSIGTTFYPLI